MPTRSWRPFDSRAIPPRLNRAARARGVRNRADPRQQAGLAGLDLQTQKLGIDAALGETAGDEPEARLTGAHEHVAQLLVIAKTPDRADARGNIITEQSADLMFQPFVAGRQHDEVGG